jgi:outer membrane receptor for monomeric catechols
VLFTAAARHQKVVVRNYSNATGLEDTSSRYTQSRWMPTFGLVYKPWETLSLYANHTEALQPGAWRRRPRQMPGRAPGSRTRNRTKWASRSIMARWGIAGAV